MKSKLSPLLLASSLMFFTSQAHAILVTNAVGTNITNRFVDANNDTIATASEITLLVWDEDKAYLGSNNPSESYDWLALGGNITPGLISQYNIETGLALPQPTNSNVILDVNGQSNYSLTGSFYAVIHYGKGSGGTGQGGGLIAWYLPNLNGIYQFAQDGPGPNGLGGISSVRIWGTNTPGGPDPRGFDVPDGGTTLASLGFALLGLGSMRRLIGSKTKA